MSYLKFDKSRMINLEYSLSREILRTNRKGAYHCTTLVECNTRKQHGLLVMPISETDSTPHVLLSSFDETVIQHGAEFNLGLHKYDGDNYSPKGHKYIREFDCDSTPKTIYRVGGVVLSKEKIFSLQDNNIMIRYTLLEAHSPTTLRFRPYLAFRSINELTYENSAADQTYREVENGICTRLYEGYPDLYMQFNKKNTFVFAPQWYKGVEYRKDMQNGFPYKEDLYVPGYFELPIKKGESIIFSAGDQAVKTHSLKHQFQQEVERHTPRSSFYNCLRNSANQFNFRTKDGKLFILNGYPWYKVKARDQFIALPGLTLATGRFEAFEEVMDSTMPALQRFMQDGSLDPIITDLDAPDVLLWAVFSVGQYAKENRKQAIAKYGKLVQDIIAYIRSGQHDNLRMLDNGLLSTFGRNQPVSWMDATVDGKPVIPRSGCLVEFNALWYNALMTYIDFLTDENASSKKTEPLEKLTGLVRDSFREVFLNEWGYLFDYVDGGVLNWSVRPNMILALSLDYSPLSKSEAKGVLEFVTKELLTPKGLRTLSPRSEGYVPYYAGDERQKAYASCNGTVRPWLLGPYLKAYLKINQFSGVSFVERMLVGIEDEMYNNCVGSLSELYDGNPPFDGHGAVSCAMNVASMLSILKVKKSFEIED